MISTKLGRKTTSSVRTGRKSRVDPTKAKSRSRTFSKSSGSSMKSRVNEMRAKSKKGRASSASTKKK